jgi:hypothetical protein
MSALTNSEKGFADLSTEQVSTFGNIVRRYKEVSS